jgi:ribosomal protein S18 acetylase RimI-like enzyme
LDGHVHGLEANFGRKTPGTGIVMISRAAIFGEISGATLKQMAEEFRIRDFRRADFFRLWEIDQKCFARGVSYSAPELLFYMRRPRAFTLVAERHVSGDGDGCQSASSEAVGFIVAEAARHTGHIITIDVLEGVRRNGLGSRLMATAEQRLRAEGCRTVSLETAVDNAAALAFYKRHAYFLVKTIPRYYSTGVDAFVLKKDLLSEGSGG